jgi:hypothetical protein
LLAPGTWVIKATSVCRYAPIQSQLWSLKPVH